MTQQEKNKTFSASVLRDILRQVRGFTLIELVLSIFLITVGSLGAFSLIQKTISFTAITSSQLQAAYLSQEGIEIVRNIRDTNWLQEQAWDRGIASSEEVVSKFKRKITISKPEPDKVIVSAEVSWLERGRAHKITAMTELYNWK